MIRALAILLCLAVLPAEELLVRDLRLGAGLAPSSFSYDTSDELATASGGDSFDDAYAVGLRASWSWSGAGRSWAPILACELLSEQAAYGTGGFRQIAVRGLGGIGWQMDDAWSLRALGMIGAGRPSFDAPLSTGGEMHLAGASAATGLLLGLQWAFARTWAVDVEVGWIQETARLVGDGTDLDMTRSGLAAGIGLVWSWSRRPVVLE